jgi:hypothetical protein
MRPRRADSSAFRGVSAEAMGEFDPKWNHHRPAPGQSGSKIGVHDPKPTIVRTALPNTRTDS